MREGKIASKIERGLGEKLKEQKFIDWLQERISFPVLKRKQELLEQKQKL